MGRTLIYKFWARIKSNLIVGSCHSWAGYNFITVGPDFILPQVGRTLFYRNRFGLYSAKGVGLYSAKIHKKICRTLIQINWAEL